MTNKTGEGAKVQNLQKEAGEEKRATGISSGASDQKGRRVATKSKIDPAKTTATSNHGKKPAEKAKPRGKKLRGRPLGTADIWTEEKILQVADLLWAYVEKTKYPSIAEFCYLNCISNQRLYEHLDIVAVKEMLLAKKASELEKAGMRITKAQGSRGAFIIRALANCGEFSMVDKSETKKTSVETTRVYIPDNGRGDGPKPEPTDA
jgi:hypothetical protein